MFKWTKEADALLIGEWLNLRVVDIAQELGISRDAILRRARKLGIEKKPLDGKRPQYYDWTTEKDAILTKQFKVRSNKALAQELGVSVQAVMHRMRKLGLSRGNDGTHHFQWTDESIATLLAFFGRGMTQQKIAEQLNISLAAVRRKIYSLGLSKTHHDNLQKKSFL
jgi:biotin operon repressor